MWKGRERLRFCLCRHRRGGCPGEMWAAHGRGGESDARLREVAVLQELQIVCGRRGIVAKGEKMIAARDQSYRVEVRQCFKVKIGLLQYTYSNRLQCTEYSEYYKCRLIYPVHQQTENTHLHFATCLFLCNANELNNHSVINGRKYNNTARKKK